jgi:hypothetical protein
MAIDVFCFSLILLSVLRHTWLLLVRELFSSCSAPPLRFLTVIRTWTYI